ncbi:MAG: penicillin-binding protein 2 [Alphaproteobacteria bacterium]|nr:penicillin-binding protein 2 [Alphaproteobacteria bacterium]
MSVWKQEKNKTISGRMTLLAGAFVVIFIVLLTRAFYLQIIQGERYFLLAERNRISTRLTMPARGYIYDRNSVVLAQNNKTFQAVLIKEQSPDFKKTLENFMRLISVTDEEHQRILDDLSRKRAFMPVRLKDNLSFREIALIQLNMPDLLGVEIEEGLMRSYRHELSASHVVGYVSLLNERDIKDGADTSLLDLPGYRIGRFGIESALEGDLKGVPGRRKVEINALGRSVRVLEETPPAAGKDIRLTIDIRLQSFITRLLEKFVGSAAVVNVHTGEVLAMVSMPSFDPNLLTMPISVADWNKIAQNPDRPLQNKAISGTYSPGSTFKIVVGLAGLESGAINPSDRVYCDGKIKLGNQIFHCWHDGHGSMNLQSALMHSCDVYFYEMSRRVGPEKIVEIADRLGFGKKVGIELEGEKTGLLPSPGWKKQRYNDGWRTGDTLNFGIGQGFLNATPLQILNAMAQVANGGKPVSLHFLMRPEEPAASETRLFNPDHLKIIQAGLSDVVNKEGGTAYWSRMVYKSKRMAGKTATTQVRRITLKEREEGLKPQEELPREMRDHAIFAAYAPVDAPKYAVIVFLEHAGSGSRYAGPAAAQIVKEVLRLDDMDAQAQEAGEGGR